MVKPPCDAEDGTRCPNRHVGCQAQCEKYLAFREERHKELEHKEKNNRALNRVRRYRRKGRN